MNRSKLLSSTYVGAEGVPLPIKNEPGAGSIVLSAWVRKPGSEWVRVSRVIDKQTQELIWRARGENRTLVAARALGIDVGLVDNLRLEFLQTEERVL